MEDVTIRAAEGFAERLARLRNAKGVSGREMSLSMGQAAGYVNNIENGNNLPSLAMFFEICEYLGVTPQEFFSYTRPSGDEAAWDALQRLSPDDRALVIRLAERLGEERR
ncbi:MAG: helix-turn-helix transcriptional regulator [Firmicutes bacterium]|nr:helix-turn-helix transcriptional regulator [Bacillota bacterium]MBR6969157.1 helix-turn-helix transcriptional regulator [Bacillota bacterium]